MKITKNFLIENCACKEAMKLFEEHDGEGKDVETIIEKLEEIKDNFSCISWLFEKCKLSGVSKTWHDNGNKWEVCNYVNGELHGKYERWHYNGNKWEVCNYVNWELHGKFERWHDNGNKWKVCNYVNGELHGKYENWYSDGNKCVVCNFVNGELKESTT